MRAILKAATQSENGDSSVSGVMCNALISFLRKALHSPDMCSMDEWQRGFGRLFRSVSLSPEFYGNLCDLLVSNMFPGQSFVVHSACLSLMGPLIDGKPGTPPSSISATQSMQLAHSLLTLLANETYEHNLEKAFSLLNILMNDTIVHRMQSHFGHRFQQLMSQARPTANKNIALIGHLLFNRCPVVIIDVLSSKFCVKNGVRSGPSSHIDAVLFLVNAVHEELQAARKSLAHSSMRPFHSLICLLR